MPAFRSLDRCYPVREVALPPPRARYLQPVTAVSDRNRPSLGCWLLLLVEFKTPLLVHIPQPVIMLNFQSAVVIRLLTYLVSLATAKWALPLSIRASQLDQ